MSSTLSEGVRVPDIGSVNWGADVNFNWGLLNTALANISGNVKVDAENTWTAPQTFTETISGSIDGVAARAVGDEDGNNIKTALAGKQPSLSQSQLAAVNSGITASAVQQIGINADNISALQTAVAGKAADDSVVHLAGAETITGDKTHDANLGITGNHLFAWDRPQVTMGTNPTSGVYFGTQRFRDSNGDTFLLIRGAVNTNGNTFYSYTLYPWSAPTEARGWTLSTTPDASISYFNPIGAVHLGSTSSKWQSLNGINPGALSLPDPASAISLDTTNWNITNYTINTYITPSAGYISVAGTCEAIQIDGSMNYGLTSTRGSGDTFCECFLPVPSGARLQIRVKNCTHLASANFYPCLGNV